MSPQSTASPPRFEHTTLPNGVRLAVHRTAKLKTILVRAYFRANLDDDVTARALVPMVLRRGTRSFPDMQLLSRRREELWACQLHSSLSKLGESHVVRFTLDVVNDAFLPPGNDVLAGGLELLRGMIADPVVVDGSFRSDWVAQEKENLRLTIESIVDNKAHYANVRCVEEMCRDEPFRLDENGRVADIDVLDGKHLLTFHRDGAARAPLSIYVAGDIDPELARRRVAGVFAGERGKPLELWPLPDAVEPGEVREIIESLDVSQGRLVLGFRHDMRYGDPGDEAFVLMNTVLGGGGNSLAKLFQNVREKASMAYSAYSSIDRLKGIAFICCGVDVEKFEKARDLSLAQVDAIRGGDVSDAEIESARRTILESSRMLEDSFSSLMEGDYARGLVGQELDLERLRQRVAAVTRDEIVAAASRLRHDTTYFLRN